MEAITLALCFALALPAPVDDATADALLAVLVEYPTDIPHNLPPALAPALARLWVKRNLWTAPAHINDIPHAIQWTRDHNGLPPLTDIERLPDNDIAHRHL